MRRISVLIVVAFFVLSVMPAFAQEKKQEENLFNIIAGTLKPGQVKERNKLRKVEKITLFQDISTMISEGSARAKGESLRTKK